MLRATLSEFELEYDSQGSGEAVVLVHHGAGADWFAPLCDQPTLSSRYRLVRYHRAGYAGSGKFAGQLTFAREASTFRELMHHLGIERAHVVGHSASGCISLQIALDVPDIVHSLALLEPALMAVASPPDVLRALELYRAGDVQRAVETFLRATCGEHAPAIVETHVPGAMRQALTDADTFFAHELPALRQWTFGADEARRITQPVLAAVGERSDSRFQQRQELLLKWLPNVEPFVLANAGHLLHIENAGGLAERLVAFFARHPIGVAV